MTQLRGTRTAGQVAPARSPFIGTIATGRSVILFHEYWARSPLIGTLATGLSWLLVAVLLIVGGGVGYGYWRLQASLPALDGERILAGLEGPVTVTRDALGIPTVTAQSEADLYRAQGFLHGQERFFQMDLLRRAGAGELSALLGPAALPADKARRVHRLRFRSQKILATLTDEEATFLRAYTEGVNAGLTALGANPFEYGILRAAPEPWRPEDSLLVIYAMHFDLQDWRGSTDLRRGLVTEALPPKLAAFLDPKGTSWDAPLDHSQFPVPALPIPEDLHGLTAGTAQAGPVRELPSPPGSNNWAVSGKITPHGAAILADDMHLGHGVPNIWYRARMILEGEDGFDVTGATLPGTMGVVAGSNGRIAWGYTNSYIDTSDLVVIEPANVADRYRIPTGSARFERVDEVIEVRGGENESLTVEETVWGPVVLTDWRDRKLALRWIGHDPESANLKTLGFHRVKTIEEGMAVARAAGMPNQNTLLASATGRIAWVISGPIPDRFGHDGRVPASWADGARGWRGYIGADDVPATVDPDGNRLWTANSRVMGLEAYARFGDGGYDRGARAAQIRDDLRALDQLAEPDLFRIQLDDRAVFLTRWRKLFLDQLGNPGLDDPRLDSLREEVRNWGGHAAVSSAGYRLVRAFRSEVFERVMAPWQARLEAVIGSYDDYPIRGGFSNQVEQPLWTLADTRPEHFLPEGFESWEALFDDAIRGVLASVDRWAGGEPSDFTWGRRNTVRIGHPLSGAVPFLGRLTDVPPTPLPGDRDMPRVQYSGGGASQRLVVAPGHEDKGIFHMPSGQASNPLSPYFNKGHDAWAEGKPTPFLPGPPAYALTLQPGG